MNKPTMLSLSAYAYNRASDSALGHGFLNSDTNSFNNQKVRLFSRWLPHTNSSRNLRWAASHVKIKVIGPRFEWEGRFYDPQRHLGVLCFQKTWPKESSGRQNTVQVNPKPGGDPEMTYAVGQPSIPPFVRLNAADQVFLLLTFIACMTTGALVTLVITAIPALNAMRRAALSLEKLADTAREELPGTMATIRLTGMEINDLTLEFSDLSQEVTEGIRKSAQVFRAAEAGIRRIGGLASSRAISMLQERANLPVVSMKPAISEVTEITSHAIQRARKALWHIIPLSRFSSRRRETESERWQAY